MLMYTLDKTDDKDILFYQKREQLLSTLEHRFTTYGYKKIQTPTFEPYDLYSTVTGTVPLDEMIKVIDQSGKVLVMRPDVTIPITRQIASKCSRPDGDIRYCYVADVFRQTAGETNNKERTQAGVEYFGSSTPEADAEVLALAVHTLNDLDLPNFTLEIGHAGFTKELLSTLDLPDQQLEQFRQLIQAKNLNGMKQFLAKLDLEPELRQSLESIPLLYGKPMDVIRRAKKVAFNAAMHKTLDTLEKVLNILQAYGASVHTVIDLALINNMDYYSGTIFQGFAGNVGKPILMGGRYDRLADQFNASIPAIGFACDVNALLESTQNQQKTYHAATDIIIYYEQNRQDLALAAANQLREAGYCVLSYPKECYNSTNTEYTICFTEEENILHQKDRVHSFDCNDTLLQLIQEKQEVQ